MRRAPVALDGVSCDLAGRRILDDVTLALEPGAITVLVVTNEPAVARRIADDLVVLRAGRVVEHGGATALLGGHAAFGRRLLAGDLSCGLAMADERFQRESIDEADLSTHAIQGDS